MTNRQIEAMKTKKKIVDATRKLLKQKSFEEISIGDIAKEAGVATGSFYTYFKKKESIIKELAENDFYHLDETVNKMMDKSVEYRLNYYARSFLSEIERVGIEICRQWIKNNLSGFIEEDKYEYDYKMVRSILDHAIKSGELSKDTPVKDLAQFINSQLYGLMLAWCMSDGKIVGSKQIDKYSRLIVSKVIEPYILKED